jgi:hypothetical protein
MREELGLIRMLLEMAFWMAFRALVLIAYTSPFWVIPMLRGD